MKNSSLTLIAVFGIYLLFCLPASYAGNGNKGNHHSRISVTISPTASSLQPGQSQQFAATVSGTSNTAINWLVNGSIGGSRGYRHRDPDRKSTRLNSSHRCISY